MAITEEKKMYFSNRRENDPEYRRKKNEYGAAWKKNNADKLEQYSFTRSLKEAGWTAERYNAALTSQQFLCAICKQIPVGKRCRLVPDHCHVTLTPRGLLCRNCNLGIGHFKDNIEFVKNAMAYLSEWKTQ